MEKTTYTKNGDSYTFWNEGNWLFVEYGGKIQSMKVVDDNEFVFKLQKTQIRAHGGAKELCEWMKEQVENNDIFLTHTGWVLHWVIFRDSEAS